MRCTGTDPSVVLANSFETIVTESEHFCDFFREGIFSQQVRVRNERGG